jgi:alanine racemase
MAVVKGDAYGHGLTECSKALCEAGADCLGVLDVNEGARIREAKITEPEIFILAGIDSSEAVREALGHDLSVVAYDFGQLELLGRLAGESRRRLKVFLKTDTGMGRLGVEACETERFVQKSLDYEFLDVLGLSTHLPAIGDPMAVSQLKKFSALCAKAEKIIGRPLLKSALSGAAILAHPSYPDGISRPGLVLYGTPPLLDAKEIANLPEPWLEKRKEGEKAPDPSLLISKLLPVMRVASRIIQLKTIRKGESVSYGRTFMADRDLLVAAAPFGYVHGFSSSRSGKARALVRGEKAPQIGRICMNLSMFDVSRIPGVRVGDELVFLGESGGVLLDAYQESQGERQNPYEILCLYGRLNKRSYV